MSNLHFSYTLQASNDCRIVIDQEELDAVIAALTLLSISRRISYVEVGWLHISRNPSQPR